MKDTSPLDGGSPSALQTPSPGRFKVFFLLSGILLAGFLGSLLFYNNQNLRIIEQNVLRQKSLEIDGKVKNIDYFLSERVKDLQNQAEWGFVPTYFANISLGMSEFYGLKESRNLIVRQFQNLNESILYRGKEVYSRLVLFSSTGERIAEMNNDISSRVAAKDSEEFADGFPQGVQIRLAQVSPEYLLIVVPVKSQKHIDGYMAGWIDLESIHEYLLKNRDTANGPNKNSDDIYVVRVNQTSFIFNKGKLHSDNDINAKILSILKTSFPGKKDQSSKNKDDYQQIEADSGRIYWLFSASERYNQIGLSLVVADTRLKFHDPLKTTAILMFLCSAVAGFFILMMRQRHNSELLEADLKNAHQRQQEILEINTSLEQEVCRRSELETVLEKEKVLLESLISAIPDLIYFKDSQTSCVHGNRAFEQFCGIKDPNALFRTDCLDLASGRIEFFNHDDSRVLLDGRVIRYEQWVESESGTLLFFDIIKSPCRTVDGKVLGLVCVSRDRTKSKELEMELAVSHERLDLVIRATKIGLWDWGIQSGSLVVNERWAEMLGYTIEELAPVTIDTWFKLVHPADRNISDLLLKKHFAGETDFYRCEIRMRHKGGLWVWVRDQGQVVEWTEERKPVRMSGTHEEITERKEIEQRLKDNEENFRNFFESMGDMIFVGDMEGNIIFSNSAAQQKLAYSQQELMDMHLLDLHDSSRQEEAKNILASMLRGEQQFCPLSLVARNFTVIPVETRVWPGKWNGVEALFGVCKDLTVEHEAYQRFEALFRNNPALMAVAALDDGCYQDVNEIFLKTLGYHRDEVIGNSPRSLDLFVDIEKRDAARRDVLHYGRISNFELQMKCKTGEVIDGMLSAEIILTQGKMFLLTVIIDITALKNAENQLRIANSTLETRVKERTRTIAEMHEKMIMQAKMAAVGQLAAGIAHELNNPFNFMNTNFVVLRDYFTDLLQVIEQYRRVVKTVVDQSAEAAVQAVEKQSRLDYLLEDIPGLFEETQRGFERVEKIISSMRDFSHTDRTGEFVEYDINSGIEDTLIIARNVYKYHAEVVINLGVIPEIPCLPELLKQVFLNLVVNSAQAIESQNRTEKGLITINTFQEDDEIVCEFRDDGPGIPDEIRTRIFEPFFTSKAPGEGTGLGLSICYDIIVKKHNGIFQVQCPEEGGAVFVIRLPLKREKSLIN